jgi:hypothetical protein
MRVWNFMRSFWADPAGLSFQRHIHPVLMSAVDELRATLARLIAYVLALALLAVLGLSAWDQLPRTEASEPSAKAGWAVADRSYPAFAASRIDPSDKSESYEILRHPEGGRKDIFRWTGQAGQRTAELEIYRLGGEADASTDPRVDLANRMPADAASDLEAVGIIESKFGVIALLRAAGAKDSAKDGSCLGFLKQIGDPPLRISGWSCQGASTPARRAAVACLLNRLTLLASGNDPKLAEFFARAELRRGTCSGSPLSAQSADWVTRTEDPRLRGAF